MNTKRFLIVATLVALAMIIFSLVTMTKSTPAKAQARNNTSSVNLVSEPAVRMQSGAIQSSDGNAPDFRPHTKTAPNQDRAPECISENNFQPRRWGGCFQ